MDMRNEDKTTVLFVDTTPFFGPLMQVHGRVMKHLEPSKFRVLLASFSTSDYSGLLAEAPHVEVMRYTGRSSARGSSKWSRPLWRAWMLRRFVRAGWDARREHAAIVHVGMTGGMLAAGSVISLISRGRLVVHVHADPLQATRAKRAFYTAGIRNAMAVITVSGFVKRQIAALGVQPSKIWPVLNTVDLDRFHPGNDGSWIRTEYGIPPSAPLVVCLGRLFSGKGQHHLVRAMARLREEMPDARALIIGWEEKRRGELGNYSQLLDSLISGAGLEGRVIVDKARPEAGAIMAAADVVAVPSTNDPCPLTVLEAMASGKPVVGFRSGGIPEELGDDSLLVEPGDEAGLARALLTLIEDSGLRARVGAQNRRRAEEMFYERRLADDVTEIYRVILDGSSAVPRASGTSPHQVGGQEQ